MNWTMKPSLYRDSWALMAVEVIEDFSTKDILQLCSNIGWEKRRLLRRVFSAVMFILLLTGMLTLASNIQLVQSESKTWIVDDDGPADFHTIQAAINGAAEGETIYVKTGTYHEHVIVNKTVTLAGEDRYATAISGDSSGTVVTITVNNTKIHNFTIENSGAYPESGVYVSHSNGNNVGDNVIAMNTYGMQLEQSCYNTISENMFQYNDYGIALRYSNGSNMICCNVFSFNEWYGIMLDYSSGCTAFNNTVLKSNIGIRLFDSAEHTVLQNTVVDNNYGIILEGIQGSENNTIAYNHVRSNSTGIFLDRSSNNTLIGNSLSDSQVGLYLSSRFGNCTHNRVFHNEFNRNARQVYDWSYDDPQTPPSVNSWDDSYPSGGNYWSDYNGTDVYSGPYQNETGSDGIGDTPYVIDTDNRDNYPLMSQYTPIAGDLNMDGSVDILDAIEAASAFGSYVGHPNWNPQADLNNDNIIDIFDIIILANNFGKHG